MDIKQQPQVPQLQLAKVGERKRRKGGALPFFSGSGAASHSGGGIWGTVSGIAGKSVLKIGITLLAGAIGVGAYNTGKGMRPDPKQFERKPTLFASKDEKPQYAASDVANLPGSSGSSQSSVGLVSGSRDGLTEEERAAQAKAAEEASKKAAEEQAKADAQASKEPGDVQAGMPDPVAAAKAAAEKEKAAAFNRKFGELSKGGGSSLAGGGGMGSGIGRGFESLPKNKGTAGVMSSLGSNRAGGTSSAKISSGRNPGRSLAQRQLNRAVQSARQMTAGANETRVAAGAVPFDTSHGNSQLLSGTGGGSSGGSKVGTADSDPSSSGGGGGSPVGVGGGYSDAGEDDCGTLAAQYGWGGNFVNSASGGCVLEEDNVEGTGKDDPTNMYFNILKVLAIIATVLSVILLLAAYLQKTGTPPTVAFAIVLSEICGVILCAVGAIMAILGLMVVGMGRTLEGGIFTLLGTITSISGYLAYSQASDAASAQSKVVEATGKETAEELAKQAALRTAATNATSSSVTASAVGGGVSAVGNAGGGIYANNVGDRTWNSDTNSWD